MRDMARPVHEACVPDPAVSRLLDVAGPVDEAVGPATEATSQPSHAYADQLFVGIAVTMDEGRPHADAVAVKDGRIVGVGTAAELRALVGPLTRSVELGEGVLYPGLVEPHMHLWATALIYRWLDCSPFTHSTLQDLLDELKAAASAAKPGAWILGSGFDPSLFPGFPELGRLELDAVSADHPVAVMNASMHFSYVNSKALEIAGIADAAPDPPGGHFGRDADGRVNGVLGEMGAVGLMLEYIDRLSLPGLVDNIQAITDDAARVGVTTMREAATGALMGEKEVTLLRELSTAGRLRTRISLAVLDDKATEWDSKHVYPGAGDDLVWIGARKIVGDGSNQGRSGYLHEPYLGTAERGAMNIEPSALAERIAWCEEHGWQLMVHANGDAATQVVAQAFEKALGGKRGKDLRHRIEHCSLVDDGVFETMASVGVSPSFLINHVYLWGRTLRDNLLGPERAHLLDRTARAAELGLRFSLHSDYNVSAINPLHYVRVAATRDMVGGGTLNEAERVSVHDALRAVTIDAAWQLHADDVLGSISVGKYADFVVLDRDPEQVDPGEIDQIRVVQTWMGGKCTYRAEPPGSEV
jgi:predicted amidohydrolase YtcJ